MNKIDAAIDAVKYAVESNKIDKDKDSLLSLGFSLKDHEKTILEALQAMKAEQPDTIHNDDWLEEQTAQETIELWKRGKDHDTISKNHSPNLTQYEGCVRGALDYIYGEIQFKNITDKTAAAYDVISTALLAKQPDIERLKRVEGVLQEIDEYLSSNKLNQIGSGSILHKRIKNLTTKRGL